MIIKSHKGSIGIINSLRISNASAGILGPKPHYHFFPFAITEIKNGFHYKAHYDLWARPTRSCVRYLPIISDHPNLGLLFEMHELMLICPSNI